MSEKVIHRVEVVINDENENIGTAGRLLFSNGKIIYGDQCFQSKDIDEIELSMCSMASSIKLQVLYFVDLNITAHRQKHYFQIDNTSMILDVIEWIKKDHISYTDVLEVENIFKQYPDELARWKYINRHFHQWAKQYHLDNPRDNYFKNYYNEIVEVINDFIETYKK